MANSELTVADLFAKIGALVVRGESLEQRILQLEAELQRRNAEDHADASADAPSESDNVVELVAPVTPRTRTHRKRS